MQIKTMATTCIELAIGPEYIATPIIVLRFGGQRI